MIERVRLGLTRRPRFSFAIPVFDRTRFVFECVRSALNQDHDDFEIVIVLDGSPLETREIVREFDQPHIRVFSYNQPSGTACRGRNRAIVEARGDYICLLDSDDIADPKRLKNTEQVISDTGADVVYGAIGFIVDAGRSIPGITFGDIAYPNNKGFNLADLIAANQLYTLSVSIRRSLLLERGGFRPEMRYREDYELWLRLKLNNAQFSFTNEVLGLYRIHGGNHELTFKADDSLWYQKSLEYYKEPFYNWGL